MSSNRQTLLRQWQMLRLIPRYPIKITARDIKERLDTQDFKVAKRTIERDMQALSEVFPLLCDDRNKPYGWSWQKDAPSFDLPGLAPNEALVMKLVERFLSPLLPASVTAQLQPHFKAADMALKNPSRASGWTRKIHAVPPTQPLLPPAIKPDVQRAIYEALLQNQRIKAAYLRRGDSRPAEYTLNPLAIVQRGAVTYLIGTAFDYSDILTFALHRFQNAEILDEAVRHPAGFDLDDYIASGALGFGSGKKIKLEALFENETAEHLYETPLSADQSLKLHDKHHIKLTATVTDTAQLRWWLLGFGDAVKVLAPAKLRKAMAEAAHGMSRAYSKH